jgi:hypothetical protein
MGLNGIFSFQKFLLSHQPAILVALGVVVQMQNYCGMKKHHELE